MAQFETKGTSPLRRRIREATREALLSAAEATIASRGLHNTRIEDIAVAAGVAVGTIYNYFADRQTLVEALLLARRQEMIAKIGEALERSRGLSFTDRLELFVRTAVEQFEAHRPLFALLVEQELSDLRRGKRPGNPFQELAREAADLVRYGIEEQVLEAEGADCYPLLLLGMIRGLIASSLYRKPASLSPLVPVVTRVFLDGARHRQV